MGNKQSSPATPASPKLSGPANKKLGARRKRSAMLQTNRAVANQRAADVVSNHAQRLGAAVLNLKNATRAASKAAEEAVLAVERFIARAAEKNQLHQLLDAGMTAARLRELDEQLTRVADEHGIAVDHDLGALDRAIEMDASKLIELVQTNLDSGKDMFELPHGLIDTLVAIDRRKNQLLDAVLESQRPKLIEMLQATSADIVTRRGRGLSVEYPWSIDHETVEIFPDQRLSKSSFIRVLRGSWQGRDIVVRMFPESRGGDVMSMFLNEVELWYSLNHPNVLKLLGACIDTDWPFTVAPTMNDNILTYIRKNPTTSIEARIGILLDAARGMQYLHEQKPPIVHGNLEAANILLDFEGRAMICDFGLAFKKFGPDDDAMNRRGMTHWNAPEVNDTQYKLELPSDVFAFAMTAIEVLTGERPFAGEPVKGPISEWIVWGERPKRPDGTPDALWSVIEDCWQHNPASRPTFRQVVRRLEVMTPEGAARLEASATHYAKALETIVPQILINAGAARALVELVSDVAAALDESITTGDNDAARSSIGAFRALLSEIDFLFKTTAEKSLLRQMLAIDKTRTGIKQISERLLDAAKAAHLAIELDTSIIVAAFDSDLAALPAALDRLLSGVDKKFDVQTQCLETLHAIERQRDDLLAVVSEEMRNRLLVLLEETSTDIISRAGRSLSSRREWTIDPDDVLILYDRKIGEGGFGEVYPARWNGRDVAVKVFAAAKGPSATMLIEREAFVWSQLQHENVLRLHGVCTDADRPFIVMPFVREDAAGLVTMMQSLSADVSVGILLGVARGMQYLHECQRPVIHGSLKAKAMCNCRVPDETGAVLISDFGMSLVKSNSSINTKRRADELRWVAPEVHTSGYKLAKPSDVFAFAMMAVEVLTGDVPFGADVSSNEVVAKIKAGERPARPDGVPDALWQVVEECWQQDPGARPSFAAVVERLKQLPSAPLTFDKIFAVESLSRRAYAAAKIAESCVKAAKVFVVDRAAAVWLAESAVEVAAALSDALKQAAHGLTVDDIQTVVGQIADAKRFLSWIADMNPVGQVLRFKATASRITQLGAAMFAAAKASVLRRQMRTQSAR
nr:Leucine-rich repeat serine/threonine-protein kinase 2 [Polyrhizophydium stewartii]